MELGKWLKVWIDQNSDDGSDYNDSDDVQGWLGVTRAAGILTVTYEPGTEEGEEPGPTEYEYYRVDRIAEPPTGQPLT